EGLLVLVQAKRDSLAAGLLSESDSRAIFSNVETICNFNVNFLKQLGGRFSGAWSAASTIGDLFIEVLPFFKVYHLYCDNYEHAAQRFRELVNSQPKWAIWLKRLAEANNGASLQSFLITPVQRIPRYQLLLRDLRKRTPDEHPDSVLLDKAC